MVKTATSLIFELTLGSFVSLSCSEVSEGLFTPRSSPMTSARYTKLFSISKLPTLTNIIAKTNRPLSPVLSNSTKNGAATPTALTQPTMDNVTIVFAENHAGLTSDHNLIKHYML